LDLVFVSNNLSLLGVLLHGEDRTKSLDDGKHVVATDHSSVHELVGEEEQLEYYTENSKSI
jgi:hypothetical protein